MVENKDVNGIRILEFAVGPSRYQIAPEMGFRLMRWSLSTFNSQREILYWPDTWKPETGAPLEGGNPILFPFCGRSFDRGLKHHWRSPDGKRRPMPMHGFAKACRFDVSEQGDNWISGILAPSEEASEIYPFDYTFTATYSFEELAFSISLTLENSGEEPVPWSAGHHFFFTLPWHEFARRKDYQLNMEAKKCAYHSPDGKLAMQKDRTPCRDLSDTELLDRIHWELRHNRVSFGPKGGEEDVHLVIGKEPVPPKAYSVVTWSPSEDSKFYCIEPWMGPPNAAGHGKGLHWVSPGESAAFDVEVSLY